MHRPGFVLHAHLTLALYAVTAGDTESEERHAVAATKLAKVLGKELERDWAELERKVYAGNYAEAREQLAILQANHVVPFGYEYLFTALNVPFSTVDAPVEEERPPVTPRPENGEVIAPVVSKSSMANQPVIEVNREVDTPQKPLVEGGLDGTVSPPKESLPPSPN